MQSFDILLAEHLLEKSCSDDADLRIFLEYLFRAAYMGHLCVDIEHLKPDPDLVLEREAREEVVRGIKKAFKLDLVFYGKYIALPAFGALEERLAEAIAGCVVEKSLQIDTPNPPGLNSEQLRALTTALTERTSIIAGGPGTGKSYTIGAILEASRGRILVAAPTGKAVAQLEERLGTSSNVTFSTLHKALGRGRPYRIPLDYDLIIVDECSMCDAKLMNDLFKMRMDRSRLILVGDPEQLPPVESGHVFSDLVAIFEKHAPHKCRRLIDVLRTESSEILALAKAFNRGQMPKEHLFIEGEIDEVVWEAVQKGRAVLCPLRKGPDGIDALNRRIAERKGPGKVPIILRASGSGLVNGETGEGILGEKGLGKLYFRGKEFEGLDVELAFCLSVHKAQGSEFDEALLLMPKGSERFGREVLYTAATRARKKIFLWGEKEVYENALQRESIRTSALQSRVSHLLEGERKEPRGSGRDRLALQKAHMKEPQILDL